MPEPDVQDGVDDADPKPVPINVGDPIIGKPTPVPQRQAPSVIFKRSER